MSLRRNPNLTPSERRLKSKKEYYLSRLPHPGIYESCIPCAGARYVINDIKSDHEFHAIGEILEKVKQAHAPKLTATGAKSKAKTPPTPITPTNDTTDKESVESRPQKPDDDKMSDRSSTTSSKRIREEYSKSLKEKRASSSRPSSRQSEIRTPTPLDEIPSTSGVSDTTHSRMEVVQPIAVAVDDHQPFIKPTKTIPLHQLVRRKSPVQNVTLENRYKPIEPRDPPPGNETETDIDTVGSDSEYDEERTPEQVRKKAKTTMKQTKKDRPPPLVIQGNAGGNAKRFVSAIKERIQGKFEVKYTKSTTIVYTHTKLDYEMLKAHLTKEYAENKIEFHTYTIPEQKTHAFVMRGFDGDFEPAEIKAALEEEHNINIKEVYLMKKTNRPLYLIITDTNWTLKKLNAIVRAVLHVRITWEHRKATRPISQCGKCLQWGHSKTNCYKQQQCAHCGGNHSVQECIGTEDPPKCKNCKEQHRASSIECPVYKFRIAQIKEAKEKTEAKYVPAPTPVNRWKNNTNTVTMESRVEYPPLPGTSQRSQDKPVQILTDIGELQKECEKLNNIINLKQALLAIRRLTSLISECDGSPASKLTVLNEFICDELPKYNI